jgi:hypothetical protein
MAHLWVRHAGEWAVLPLDRTPLTLTAIRDATDSAAPAAGCPMPRAVLARTGSPDRAVWHLVAAPDSGVRVNGLPLAAGLRVLADRDEVRAPGLESLFYSTERLAAVEPLPELGGEVSCPRCRQPIAPASPAVRCPGCNLWHHETGELPCWTYAPTCALCPQSTASDAGFRWTPEEV